MNKLEEYFNNSPIINTDFYNKNEEYNIPNKELFKSLVNINLWANNLSFTGEQEIRTSQDKFREELINRDVKCVVTQHFEKNECEACHIISVKDGGSYDLNNGLLINSIHHKTFDQNLWCINPDDFTIDVLTNDRNIVGSIIDYKDKPINVNVNNIMKNYLKKRWAIYTDYKTHLKN